MFLRTKNKRNGRHSRKSKKQLWRGILSAVLCVAFLSTNVGGAFSVAAAETLLGGAEDTQEDTGEGLLNVDGGQETEDGDSTENPEELPPDSGSCVHHPEHDAACGYTEENPVCTFVCAICAVQRQIDALLTQNAEEQDEALLEQIRAAKEAYQALSPEEQVQIANADALFAILKEEQPEEVEQAPNPSGDNLCTHHPAHDAACGYTEENPVCTFVCAVCPVQQQIDDALARLEQVDPETLDEAAAIELYEELLAAKRAYEGLEPEQQAQMDAEKIEMLLTVLETFAIQTLDDATMEIKTAEIWAEGTANQTLTNGGEFSVDFSKQFTLHIEVKSTLNLPNKKVAITVPDGLTVVEYPIPERGGMAESVTPESIDKLKSANNYGGYCPQNGTITYSLKNTAEENSFNIILAPDTTLWNRKKEQTLGSQLTVKVYTDGENGQEYQTISAAAKITGNYDAERAIQTGPRLSRIGVKNGVPTAANQPFALRQIWINPDKDYIDMAQFFKKLEITIALPYFVKDGSNVYAELDHITWDPPGESPRPNMLDPEKHKDDGGNYVNGFNFRQTDNADHTVTLTWENLYLEYGQEYFTPYFRWTEECTNTAANAVKWSNSSILINSGNTGAAPTVANGAVNGTITWADDSVWYPLSQFTGLSFTARAGESMTVTGGTRQASSPIYNEYSSDPSIVYYLGQFHVVNHGGDASAKKVVEFTYANNGKIGVTAQKIPATTGNNVSVWYTTTESESSPIPYGNALTSEGGFVTFTAEMAGLQADEYFTSIIASVGSYEKDYVGYVSSRSSDPTSGYATTFGKLLTGDAGTYNSFATMTMYDDGPEKTNQKTANYNVVVTGTAGEIPPGMEQAYVEGSMERMPILSKTKATAGDTITFNGLLSSSAYPYSSNNIMTDPVIYIRLPEKITVKNLQLYQEAGRMADKVFLFDAVTETVDRPIRTPISGTLEEVSAPAATADGATGTAYKLYKIDLAGNKVGWFTDTLGQYQIGISFDMEIAKDAEAMTLDMRDCVRFKSASLASTSNNGTLSQYQVFDTYDMDNDGKTDVRFSTFNVNVAGTKLSVVAARLGLTFTFGAKMVDTSAPNPDYTPGDYTNYEVDGQRVFIKDNSQAVDMLFTLKNETGRAFSEAEAKAFYYFIPVPKAGDFWDSHMQDQPFDFDMKLNGEPTVNGVSKDNVLVKYSTTVQSKVSSGDTLHYSNPDNYVEANQINDWSEVKMIRIAVKETATGIRENAEMEVYMHLVPEFVDNADLVGETVNFGPCGVSPYSVGNTTNQGHNPLPRIQVEFQTGVIEGKIFIDKDFDGKYTEGTDELYTKDAVQIYAPHWNNVDKIETTPDGGVDNHKISTRNGNYEFTGRMADTYHVIVTNPGGTDVNDTNPLRFSLPGTNSKFSLGNDPGTATATVTLAKGDGTANLEIGLQQPHKVIFKAENASLDFGSGSQTNILTALFAAAKSTQTETKKVWHGETLGNVVPTVTADEGYRFIGWQVGDKTYANTEAGLNALKALIIEEDTTITAVVEKLYSVTYNGNGNTAGTVPQATTHIAGEQVTPDYTGTEQLKKGENTIFVGWSEEQITDVLQADAVQETIDKIISADEHTMPAHDVTLYAVYATDANGNGNPDYNDDSVHVRYHGNNNVRTDYICPHHHVVGGKAALSISGMVSGREVAHDEPAANASGDIKPQTFTYDTNIFIGWSTTPILDQVIETEAKYDTLKDSIVTEVTMLDKAPVGTDAADTSKYADADGNTNVYAVWAADRNGNKVADYLEEYKLTYDGNAQQGGTVSDVPTDGDIHLPGDKVTLTGTPTYTDVDGKKVVFIGWTETQTNSIYSRADTAPTTIREVTFADADKMVYAAWGYDEDGKNGADVLETYSLSYDLNGGSGTAPQDKTGIQKGAQIPLSTEKNFTRNGKEIFVGWSRENHNVAFKAGQKEDIEKILITGTQIIMGTANVTLYAVWAEDRNGNGTPDYAEGAPLHIQFNGNPCGGTVNGVPEDMTNYLSGEKLTLESITSPTHDAVNGKSVLFIGWTPEPVGKILGWEDEDPVVLAEVTFAGKDITLYAVWGYDEDKSGKADVLEAVTVAYDLNGGRSADGETYDWERMMPNTDITVKKAPIKSGCTFNGWSIGATICQPGDALTVTGDTILTAQWSSTAGSDGGSSGSTYYILHWQSNGGTEYGDAQYAANTVARLDRVPIREGYTFTGWYADAALTQRITEITMNGSRTVYAGWEPTDVPQWLDGKTHFAYVFGYEDGTVHPLHNISRAEVSAIFFRLLDGEIRDGNLTASNPFVDVQEGDWYNTSVSTMARLGILKGRTGDCFAPDAPITRAEFAAICARFDTSGISGGSNFTDISDHWAQGEIARAAALGWIKGYEDGTFRPENYITRAEAMTMINRMLNRLPEDEADLLKGMKTWSDNKPGTWYYLTVQEATNSHAFTRRDGVHEQWTALTADEA